MPGAPRESTLARWHREGLPEGIHYMEAACDRLGIEWDPCQAEKNSIAVDFRMIPQFEEKVLEHKDGHYLVRDWMGAVVEISDQYDVTYLRLPKDFVTRKWHKFPVTNREEWAEFKKRYDPDEPCRIPGDTGEQSDEQLRVIQVNGPYWQLREWLGFENLSRLLLCDPAWIEEMIAYWTDFVARVLERALEVQQADSIWISEDMAFKMHPMIGPDMTRALLAPAWRRWIEIGRRHGVGIFDMDSDGYIESLIPGR